jgi:hypothetical protein
MVPEQVAGHQIQWAEDNLKNYPYLLINPITTPDGSQQAAGPVAYTRSPQIPPAMAALLQLTEVDMQDILGNQNEGDKIVSNISGKAVEMIQQRLDNQTFIYMSNFAVAVKRSGEIWLSMAQETYVEEDRAMKGVDDSNRVRKVVLMTPRIDEDTGRLDLDNDLSRAKLDVVADVGPSSASKKAAAVRALTGMLTVTSDPETQQVLQALSLMNMEAEGLVDARDFFRKRLVSMGVVKPTETELEEMAALAGQEQPADPNAIYLQAAAEEAVAKAEKARADVLNTIADAELTQAKTATELAKLQGVAPSPAPAMPAQRPPALMIAVGEGKEMEKEEDEEDEIEREKRLLELENLRIDTAMKFNAAQKAAGETQIVIETNEQMRELKAAETFIKDAAEQLVSASNEIQTAIKALVEANKKNADAAIAAISKPKRIVREKGRIVGVEVG